MPKRKRPDFAHRETDRLIEELEQAIADAYSEAAQGVYDTLMDYMRRFEAKDEKWQLWVAQGKKTEEEYKAWRTSQLMMGDRWEAVRNGLANDLVHADEIAQALVNGEMPQIYALNHNFSTFEIEKSLGMSTNYTLYSPDTVKTLLKENPKLLPKRKVEKALDYEWNARRVQSTMLQGILQGKSIPNMAKDLAAITDGNISTAIRNARTMATAAQNAGRQDAMTRAVEKGVKIRKTWLATLDGRTRHEHRVLDGQTVDVNEPFKVEGYEIMFPGDPSAAPEMVYNCRCRTITQVKGFERNVQGFDLRNDPDLGGMSYEEWKNDRSSASQEITHQKDVGEAIRGSYYGEYANG